MLISVKRLANNEQPLEQIEAGGMFQFSMGRLENVRYALYMSLEHSTLTPSFTLNFTQ